MTEPKAIHFLAERAMGCVKIVKRLSPVHWALVRDTTNPRFAVFDVDGGPITLTDNNGEVWNPFTSISNAMLLPDAIVKQPRDWFRLDMCRTAPDKKYWSAVFVVNGRRYEAEADTAMAAICWAAVAALGGAS